MMHFLIPICLLFMIGHVDSISLIDLVKQSAAKLKTSSSNRHHSSWKEGISKIDTTSQSVGRTPHADSISDLPQQAPAGSKVKTEPTSGTVMSSASIQNAADLVLQYIQLTPNFKTAHGIGSEPDKSPEKSTAKDPTGNQPPESSQGSSKELLSPEQQLALLLSVADEIKQIGTPGSGITLQDSIKLLMELAPNASLPLKGPSVPLDQIQQVMEPKGTKSDSTCSGHCPPKWISIVDFFSHLVSPGSEMCHFYQTMELQSCDTPNSACKPGYTCCASTCLNKIVVCDPWYPHKVPDHICLPKDVSSWWPEVHNKLPHIVGHGRTQSKGPTSNSAIPA